MPLLLSEEADWENTLAAVNNTIPAKVKNFIYSVVFLII
jgi:hypothetical protein